MNENGKPYVDLPDFDSLAAPVTTSKLPLTEQQLMAYPDTVCRQQAIAAIEQEQRIAELALKNVELHGLVMWLERENAELKDRLSRTT